MTVNRVKKNGSHFTLSETGIRKNALSVDIGHDSLFPADQKYIYSSPMITLDLTMETFTLKPVPKNKHILPAKVCEGTKKVKP